MVFESEKDPDFNALLKLFFFFICCCQFVTAKQKVCDEAVFRYMWKSISTFNIWFSMGSDQRHACNVSVHHWLPKG